ncbi:hypothetical protein RHSIM_RhsimUnG0256200 [Rhododendron simsii]|uniref:S-locus receptor kinase C-terminal domain-containing protein n=1 Tax=Rhododendron simsii TaxID=118357 RepID=A0A834FU21_RHOSS|nr:hypothetical protein RHSIM_RhsimUnG0256200 [Rhododendron simsii]
MDHSSPCSSHDAAGYSSLLLLLVEAEVTKQRKDMFVAACSAQSPRSNGPDNFYPVGEDLVLFNLGTSIGAANCNVNESGKSHTGKRKEVDLPLFSFASAWDLWKSGRGEGIKDPILQDIPSTNLLLRYVNIALLCVQESVADRPTMSNVVSMLSNELVLPASPKQPAFSNGRSVPDQNSGKQLKICSITDETVSILEGR